MLSKRHKIAAIERARNGIGVSTSARIYARKYYGSWGWQDMAKMRNTELNDIIGQDFEKAEPKHRFKLKSGETAEIRQSQSMYYVAAMRGGTYDIIVIQSAYKPSKSGEKEWRPGE